MNAQEGKDYINYTYMLLSVYIVTRKCTLANKPISHGTDQHPLCSGHFIGVEYWDKSLVACMSS